MSDGVLVVDDDDFTRALVCSLVESLGHHVCGTASAVTEAMSLAQQHKPHLAIIDLDLGEGPTGIDLAHGLRKLNSQLAIVMLTAYGDPAWMGQRRNLPVGVRYVVKGDVRDSRVLSEAVDQAIADPLSRQASAPAPSPLSENQWEVLRLVAAGYSNAEIARRRSLTEDAVNKAVTRLVKQLALSIGKEANARVLLTQAYNQMTGTVSERRS